MVRSRQRKARDPDAKPAESKSKDSESSKADCGDPKDPGKDRRHGFNTNGDEPQEKGQQRSRSKSTGKIDKQEVFGAGPIELKPPMPPTRLIGPTQSPRDPNLYRAIRLSNGIRIALISNCGFNPEEFYIQAKKPPKTSGRVKDGNTKKCRRAESDMDTPSSKRSRPAQKDYNCLDVRIAEFNKDVLHLCETPEECPATPGAINFFSFICCSAAFATPDENATIEGDSDKPIPDPVADTTILEDEFLASEQPNQDPDSLPDTSVPEVDAPPGEVRVNKWHKTDPAEDDESEETVDCSPELMKDSYNVSSVAVTLPWGPLYEPDDAPGVGTLVRHCLHGCDNTSPNNDEETSTFMIYMRPSDVVRDIGCLAQKFQTLKIDHNCVASRLNRLTMPGSYIDRLRSSNWNMHGKALLRDPKRVKLMTTMAKAEHPVRKVGAGGKVDKTLGDLNRGTIDRAMTEFIRNNCRPEYMTVGIEAPKPLTELEQLAVKHFNQAGLNHEKPKPEFRKLPGEADPFDTEAFRKLYKVHPSPTGTCTSGQCSKSSLVLSFALPPETWRNYKTKPLVYLSYVIGHQGEGGLYTYLKSRQWITNLEATSIESSYHHNQFVTMFELHFQLTDDGFDEIESVLTATFSYLKMLVKRGARKQIFKELQRLQAIDFHSMGKTIDKLTVLRGAQHLSKALHYAVSKDMVLAPNIMTDFNGPLLSDLLSLFTPDKANILIVSDQYSQEDVDSNEPFLATKYGVKDVPSDWRDAWYNVGIYPEFDLPKPNKFIPENFCMAEEDGPESNRPLPIDHESDDFHDVWHLRDLRYQTRAGCILHFVTPLALRNVENATKMSLFNKIFKKTLQPVLYPAELAGLFYNVSRTPFGILVKVEANRDKIGLIVGTMANTLHNFQNSLTEETFAVEKALYKQHICCSAKKPNKLATDIERCLTLRNAWLAIDYLPVLDDMTLESFTKFVDAMKRDLYFLLLVVGNASIEDARQLAKSILDAMPRQVKVTCKKIDQIKVMQWPVEEQCVRVQSFDKTNKRTLMVLSFQIGLTSSKNVVCTRLIEPLLQRYFISKSELPQKHVYVMVRVTQTHNVLTISLMTWFPMDSVDPEEADEWIENALQDFSKDVLDTIKSNEFKQLKQNVLCGCKPMCTWFSSNHEINYLAQSVKLLDIESLGTPVQTTACECLKMEDLKKFYEQVFLDPPSHQRCASSAPGQKRKLAIVILGSQPVVNKDPDVPLSVAPPPPLTSVPASKLLKMADKEKLRPCNKSTCQKLMDRSKKKVVLNFALPSKSSDDDSKTDDPYYITNFRKFKGGLYKYPSYNPGY